MMALREVDRSNWWVRAVLAGFVATVVMLFVFFYGYLLAVPASRAGTSALAGTAEGTALWVRWFAHLVDNPLVDMARRDLYVALTLHAAIGLLWAVVYAAVAEPRLRGRGWMRGTLFSLLPWALSIAVFFPLVGAGPLGLALGAGPLPALGNLIVHLAYGATLGAVYSPASERLLAPYGGGDQTRWEQRALRKTEGGALFGLFMGLVAGAVLGVLALGPGEQSRIAVSMGLSDSALMAGCTIAGACLGALVGLLSTLPTQGAAARTPAPASSPTS